MSQERSPRKILLEVISLCEELENFAINNYNYQEDLRIAQVYADMINWSYNARLALGQDKRTVLNRYYKIKNRLDRAKTRRRV
jgi:hypothetical protein